jgi:glycosyltransferase involved in cell wall biosynthesis
MKILHVVAGLPIGGGFTQSVPALCAAEQRHGVEVSLATTQENCLIENHVRVVAFRRSWPRAVYFSWGMLIGLGKEVREVDVVHVHGCWTFPVWFGAWLALRHKKVLVMSPRGALNPLQLQHSAWKKRLVGWMDRWLLRRASVVHATCEGEKRWVQAFLKLETGNLKLAGALRVERPRIVVIPNGVG